MTSTLTGVPDAWTMTMPKITVPATKPGASVRGHGAIKKIASSEDIAVTGGPALANWVVPYLNTV